MSVRVLEARFHPRRKAGGPWVVVGRVRCSGPVVSIEGASGAEEPASGGATEDMIDKLRYLVALHGPHPFERLLKLRSEFWSFVEIMSPTEVTRRGGLR
jgi:hypothetical protein